MPCSVNVFVRREAFKAMKDLPMGSKRIGGPELLIQDLYVKEAYKRKSGRVAKAVLLALEIGDAENEGMTSMWTGELQLEHLLPQVGQGCGKAVGKACWCASGVVCWKCAMAAPFFQ